jgi:hypothetical protein
MHHIKKTPQISEMGEMSGAGGHNDRCQYVASPTSFPFSGNFSTSFSVPFFH